MSLIERHTKAAERLPAVSSLIGGERYTGASAGTFDHINPATGRAQASIPLSGSDCVDAAVAVAVFLLEGRQPLFEPHHGLGGAVAVFILLLAGDLSVDIAARGLEGAIAVAVVAAEALLAGVVERDDAFEAAVAVAVGLFPFVFDYVVYLFFFRINGDPAVIYDNQNRSTLSIGPVAPSVVVSLGLQFHYLAIGQLSYE